MDIKRTTSKIQELTYELKVENVMSKKVETVNPEMSIKLFRDILKKKRISGSPVIDDEILVVGTGCQGFCAKGPIVVVQPDDIFYQLLSPEDISYMVEEHFLKGRPVKKMMYSPPGEKVHIPTMDEIGFFSKQRLIALRNKGFDNASIHVCSWISFISITYYILRFTF